MKKSELKLKIKETIQRGNLEAIFLLLLSDLKSKGWKIKGDEISPPDLDNQNYRGTYKIKIEKIE